MAEEVVVLSETKERMEGSDSRVRRSGPGAPNRSLAGPAPPARRDTEATARQAYCFGPVAGGVGEGVDSEHTPPPEFR
jgi:hypothetical protein